jgi:hypothetical protein
MGAGITGKPVLIARFLVHLPFSGENKEGFSTFLRFFYTNFSYSGCIVISLQPQKLYVETTTDQTRWRNSGSPEQCYVPGKIGKWT